jgi:hypothetical protein
VCRAAGLDVLEQDGWQGRARSSGGFADGRPTHLMVHHTASGPSADGWPDADYCSYSSDIRPVCNLYLDRAGTVYVCAAGATNTNGSGIDPCGTVPDDSMNTYAIGIEAGNDGVGEPWPEAQQDAYVVLCAALCDGYGIPTWQIHSHAEWAPSRKIDPAGPSRWAADGTWPMDGFRDDVAGTSSWTPPTPDDEEDGMIFRTSATADAIYAQGSDLSVRHVTAQEGAIAQAGNPGWADSAPTLELAADVTDWLATL